MDSQIHKLSYAFTLLTLSLASNCFEVPLETVFSTKVGGAIVGHDYKAPRSQKTQYHRIKTLGIIYRN